MSETVPDNGINDNTDINGDPHHPRSFLSKNLLLLWDYHAKVQECLNRSILVAVTALLEHPDLPNKIDAMTQHYTEDLSRHHQAARQIGKDVPKLVGGFIAWQHQFLCQEFTTKARRAGSGLSKTSFGSPSTTVDLIPPTKHSKLAVPSHYAWVAGLLRFSAQRSSIPPDLAGGLATRFGAKMTMFFMLSLHIAHARDPEERRP